MSALGERFRAAREARGLTVSDVSEQIRIRSVYLSAIEDQNWTAIGAPVYVRGFLRTYARFLGLDAEEAVAEFNRSLPTGTGAADMALGTPEYDRGTKQGSNRTLSVLIGVAAVVAVVLIGFVLYNEVTMQHGAPSAVAQSSASASPSPGDAVSPSPSPGAPIVQASASPDAHGIELHFVAPSWVRVSVDGNVSMEGTFPAGTDRAFHGKIAHLTIGNAGGVEVIVAGKNGGPLGKSGEVIERSIPL